MPRLFAPLLCSGLLFLTSCGTSEPEQVADEPPEELDLLQGTDRVERGFEPIVVNRDLAELPPSDFPDARPRQHDHSHAKNQNSSHGHGQHDHSGQHGDHRHRDNDHRQQGPSTQPRDHRQPAADHRHGHDGPGQRDGHRSATESSHQRSPSSRPESGSRPAAAVAALTDDPALDGLDARAVFEKRILPIFQSPKPSSCTECHLSGVDLKDYIRPDQAATFAALRDRGMIDLENPDRSKILEFIARKPEKPNLITDEVRNQELIAFRAWIRAAVQDADLLKATADSEVVGNPLPPEVIRHARTDRVLASFIDNVWSEVRRCDGCHSPDKNQKYVKQHGEQVSWIARNDPQGTLQNLLDAGLIDTDDPDQSLVLLKPTNQVEHGGGQKMLIGDRTYKQYVRFLEDYAAVVNGTYRSAAQLPTESDEVSVASEIWLRIENIPARFDKMFLRAEVYGQEGNGWSQRPWAVGDRAVFGPQERWAQHLTVVAPRGSQRAENLRRDPLPAGRYLIKVYLDQTGKLQKDPSVEPGEAEFVGQVEVDSRWKAGYGSPTVIQFPGRR